MSDSALHGVLRIDKPQGPTSHDVVARVRRALGTRRVGHAGTLDPMATGLLVVLVGEATKLEPYLSSEDKRYLATVRLGRATDTLDVTGATVEERAPDDALVEELTRASIGSSATLGPRLAAALESERARRDQIPPAYSAIKQDGVRSHALARAGRAVELPPRAIEVRALELVAVRAAPPELDLSLCVSKGYYVRSLARDLGVALGVPAALSALRRTGSGAFSLEEAVSLDAPPSALRDAIVPVAVAAARALPVHHLDADDTRRARLGQLLADPTLTEDEVVRAWLDARGELVAVGRGPRVLRGFAPDRAVAQGSADR